MKDSSVSPFAGAAVVDVACTSVADTWSQSFCSVAVVAYLRNADYGVQSAALHAFNEQHVLLPPFLHRSGQMCTPCQSPAVMVKLQLRFLRRLGVPLLPPPPVRHALGGPVTPLHA